MGGVHDDEHTDIAVELPVFTLEHGTALGEYVIESRIGEGAMGVVFSAVHPTIGKRAAIKVLRTELCEDAQQVERFVDEARVVNQIGHPNIVDIFAFGEMPDGRRYFVMELLKGETLRDRLRRGRMSIEEAGAVIRPLARALEAAHEAGIVHRDLKPENVFLVKIREDVPQVKLLDFGVAKLNNSAHRMYKTNAGEVVGTPMYIAPEQARGGAGVGAQADIYALGAIAFELVCGRPPFLAGNTFEMITAHLMETPPVPSSLVAELPPELDDLLLAMLAKDPAARPSLAEVRQRLGSTDQTPVPRSVHASRRVVPPGVPVAALAAESGPVAVPPRRRGSGLVVAAVLVCAIGVGVVAFAVVRPTGAAPVPAAVPAAVADAGPVAMVSAPPPSVAADAGADPDATLVPDAARPPPTASIDAGVPATAHRVVPAITTPRSARVLLVLRGAAAATFQYDGKQRTGPRLDERMTIGTHTVTVVANGTVQTITLEVTPRGVSRVVQVESDHMLMTPGTVPK